MSGYNPYAVNGHSGSNSNVANPYASSNRYNDPYVTQNNESSASVNSFASRERDRRRRSNPYAAEQNPAQSSDGRRGGGYGGLGQAAQDYSYDGSGDRPRPQQQYSQDYNQPPPPSLQQPPQRQQSPRPGTRDRDRNDRGGYTIENNRSRERREGIQAPASQRDRSDQIPARNGYAAAPVPSAVPVTTRYNDGMTARRPTKSMDEVLKYIQSYWKTMEGDECVPIKVALQLMDPSSLGLADKESDFADTHVNLQNCLKGVVNEHYADFNSAVGTYHKIQNAIRESQHRVRFLKGGLMSVKDGMLSTRPELRGLAETSGTLDDTLGLLTTIEELKGVSNRLEEKISEKKFLGAVDLLIQSLRNLRRSELEEIGALSDMRSYFANQETTLVDVLVEELHDHLYLKSPYCAERWKRKKADGDSKQAKDAMLSQGANAWDRPVYHYLAELDTTSEMVEDASKNPEADTFYYMHMLVESLNKLGHLEDAVQRIEQRMPVELYKVVEKTNHEIDARYPTHLRGQLSKEKRSLTSIRVSEGRSQVLSDFLWTLYSKFEAIAEGHRLLHEVVAGVVVREGLKPDTYLGGFKELWKLYQMEIRSLLHDYLAADGDMSLRTGLTSASNTDVFARQPRDKNKKMFRLTEMDQKSASIRAEEDELAEILKSSVPGLVNKSRNNRSTNDSSERTGQDSTAAGHKLLVEPGVFNMTVLLAPSLAFLQHLKEIVPPAAHIPMSTLTSFLDDFLINIFHPQLEEAIAELCTRCMIDIDAFAEDSMWSKHSPHPVFKGTIAFMNLIRSFADMLAQIPQDQIFTQLIITQLVAYYDRCFGFYKAIVTRVSPSINATGSDRMTLKAAAAFAESGDVHDIAMEMLTSNKTNTMEQKDLVRKETQSLLATTKSSPLSSYDIIFDTKAIHQISLLYNSMQWLSSALHQIRYVDTTISSTKSHSRNASQTQNTRRWTLIKAIRTSNNPIGAQSGGTFIPLTNETVVPYDHTISSYRSLAQTTLLALHFNVRCNIIQQMSGVLRGPNISNNNSPGTNTPQPVSTNTNELAVPVSSNLNISSTSLTPPPLQRVDSASLPPLSSGLYPFVLPAPPTSASPLILNLNSDLITFESSIAGILGSREHQFITTGLARLVDRYMVLGADHIQVMNENGAERMRVDAMVLQQNLRGLVAGSDKSINVNGTVKANGSDQSKTGSGAAGLGITSSSSSSIQQSINSGSASTGDEEDDSLLALTHLYYSLFLSGPDQILAYVRDTHKSKTADGGERCVFTYDELRTLVELCFSAKLRGEDREESIKARKRMGETLLELGEAMWDS